MSSWTGADGVAVLDYGKLEHKPDHAGVPDRDLEIPHRAAVGRDMETVNHLGGDHLAPGAADHPEADPPPHDVAVDRDLGMQVRQQDRVVAAEEATALHAHMDCGAASVGLQECPSAQEELVACEGDDCPVDVGRQEHQHRVVAAELITLRHEDGNLQFGRLVRHGQRRHDGNETSVGTGNRAGRGDHAAVASDDEEPEANRCGHQDRTSRCDDDFTMEVRRPFPDDVGDVRLAVEKVLQETFG